VCGAVDRALDDPDDRAGVVDDLAADQRTSRRARCTRVAATTSAGPPARV
jgi:hypothetical protein